jgi:hypothetical protein
MILGGGESSPFTGVDGVQGSQSECDAKYETILANRIELLTRGVILVAGMDLPVADRANWLGCCPRWAELRHDRSRWR